MSNIGPVFRAKRVHVLSASFNFYALAHFWRFYCQVAPLYLLMVTVFPFLIYYMLVLLIDPHKQLVFASGKDPALSYSVI